MKTQVVVIGAGIAGVATAYQLAVVRGMSDVVIVDPRPPLTLTSDKSTECYRNWWPNKPMVDLMNSSIDLLEDVSAASNESIGLSRRGYIYATADEETLTRMIEDAHRTSRFGAGDVRVHAEPDGYDPKPPGPEDGVDILVGKEIVQSHHPWLNPETVGIIHARRAGWFSAQQAGAFMLDEARKAGAQLIVDEVTDVMIHNNAVAGVTLSDGSEIETPVVVNAGGPFAKNIAAMVDVDLPVFSEVHLKVTFRDHLQVVPRDLGMFIWSDPQHLNWSDEEREALGEEGREDVLGQMPFSCHGRPEGGEDSPYFVGLWEYAEDIRDPEWPLPEDFLYPEVVMKGLSTMMPALAPYLDGLPQSSVDGGYYTKTQENRPLIGPAGPDGFHLACAYSGFGVMVASGAADLVASHILDEPLPTYASEFQLSRYDDPVYMASLDADAKAGQL